MPESRLFQGRGVFPALSLTVSFVATLMMLVSSMAPVLALDMARAWMEFMSLPTVLDNLIADGRIRPVIAVMIPTVRDLSEAPFLTRSNRARLPYDCGCGVRKHCDVIAEPVRKVHRISS